MKNLAMKNLQLTLSIPLFVFGLGSAHAETLAVSGATTVQKRVLEPGAGALKAATGVTLKIDGSGTGKGMLALFEGKVKVAAAGESLIDAVSSAKTVAAKAGMAKINVPPNLVYHQVANDNVVLVVHASNRVTSLTRQQAQDIHTGKITNWNQVGGADLPIRLVIAAPGQAVRKMVQDGIMDGAAFTPAAKDAPTALEQLRVVGGDPGAVGAMSEAVVKESSERVKAVSGVSVSRPLGFVTIGNPEGAVKKMIDFFKSEKGKAVIH